MSKLSKIQWLAGLKRATLKGVLNLFGLVAYELLWVMFQVQPDSIRTTNTKKVHSRKSNKKSSTVYSWLLELSTELAASPTRSWIQITTIWTAQTSPIWTWTETMSTIWAMVSRLPRPPLLRHLHLRLLHIRSRMPSRPLRQQQLQLQLTIRNLWIPTTVLATWISIRAI